jgi:hypothetical protein
MKNKTSQPNQTKTVGVLPLGFQPIQDSCEAFAGERRLLAGVLTKYNNEIAAIRATWLPNIQLRANAAAHARIDLVTLIDTNRALFKSPKTRTFSDIKVGLRKQPGRIVIADPDATINLIKKHCPDQLDTLAPVTRALSKEALEKLPADLLKKISVQVTADQETVIVQAQDSDIEKAVASLIQEADTAILKQAA